MLAELNHMYLDFQITECQKHGIVVCIPKTDIPTTPVDYIPITFLNKYYKILTEF